VASPTEGAYENPNRMGGSEQRVIRAVCALTKRTGASVVQSSRRGGDRMARVELGRRTGSFAPGIAVDGKRLAFVSGCVANDAAGNLVGKGDVSAQTRQAFANMAAVLAEAGASLRDVVKITTFIVRMERYQEFSAVRAEVFEGQYPASSTVGV